jgi:hypothetical protein
MLIQDARAEANASERRPKGFGATMLLARRSLQITHVFKTAPKFQRSFPHLDSFEFGSEDAICKAIPGRRAWLQLRLAMEVAVEHLRSTSYRVSPLMSLAPLLMLKPSLNSNSEQRCHFLLVLYGHSRSCMHSTQVWRTTHMSAASPCRSHVILRQLLHISLCSLLPDDRIST